MSDLDQPRDRGELPGHVLQAYAHRSLWSPSIDLSFVAEEFNGRRWIAAPVRFVPLVDGERTTNSTVQLRLEQAQQLIDALWVAGLRPTEGSGSAGSLAATQKHLEDMRALAFALMPAPVEAPKAFR